jgi:hypothetical protein
MQITHVKSNTLADKTGTATYWDGSTTGSVAATNQIRPSDWNSQHALQFTLAGNTTNQSTVSGTNVIFNGAGGVSIGGSNGSLMISGATVPAPYTQKMLDPFGPAAEVILGQIGQSTLWLMPAQVCNYLAINRLHFPVHFTGATNSTGTYTISQGLGVYSFVNSTQISRVASLEVTTTFNHSGTQNSVSNVGGYRTWSGTVGGTTLPPGDYVFAHLSKTASVGANATISNFIVSNVNTALSGPLLGAANATMVFKPFQGSYSAQTAGFPDTIGTVHMRGSAAVNLRPPTWTVYNF